MNDLKLKLQTIFKRLMQLRVVIFLGVVALVYGFIMWRVDTLRDPQPTTSAVASQLNEANNPRIDQSTIDKITQLQDNSVNVKTLFDKARRDPFQE